MERLCRGECGEVAKFGNWCCESYYRCPGYRNKLSTLAKKRGNYGVRGRLSKGQSVTDPAKVEIFKLICTGCNKVFESTVRRATALRKGYKPQCRDCISKKMSEKMKELFLEKAKRFPFEKLGNRLRKRIIWEEQGEQCNKCGYDLFDLETGPYELHHIDGNRKNKNRDNEELLCCNCHFMTDNRGFKNRTHSEEFKKMAAELGRKSGPIVGKKIAQILKS